MTTMTYLQFLLLFVGLPILVMAGWHRFRNRSSAQPLIPASSFVRATWVLVILAVVYTTPWDNYLVKHKIWWYGPDRVLGTIGYVPIEEYAFFVLQTIMTCLWGYSCYIFKERQPGAAVLVPAHNLLPWPMSLLLSEHNTNCPPTDCWPTGAVPQGLGRFGMSFGGAFYGVALLYVALFVLGLYGLLWADASWRYLGLILSWAMPIALLQWVLGGEHLLVNLRFAALMFWPPTLYLWVADALAIDGGIWTISEQFTLGLKGGSLPLEEALFFAVTNLMVTQGLILFVLLLPTRQPTQPKGISL